MVKIPPGIVATAPTLTNPTTRSVRPGMMMKSGHPLCVKSTPVSTTTRAKMPMTTSTIPIALVDPLALGRAGYVTALTNGGGGGARGSGTRAGISS